MIARWLTMICIALLLATSAGRADAPAAPTARLAPIDEAAGDPSFLAFRNKLQAIVARKDAGALMKVVAGDIKNSFGGDDGAAKFRAAWKPDDPESAVWRCLALVAGMGGTFDADKRFIAPYVFSAFPDDVDAFETVVVTNEAAVLRAAPKADARVLRKLDHDILSVAAGFPKPQHQAGPDDWVEVVDMPGNHGFVLNRDVRSPIDYRAIFEKRRGRWRMTVLVAGD